MKGKQKNSEHPKEVVKPKGGYYTGGGKGGKKGGY